MLQPTAQRCNTPRMQDHQSSTDELRHMLLQGRDTEACHYKVHLEKNWKLASVLSIV